MPACPTRACPADEVCAASGSCELVTCDQPSAPACAKYWHCDPAAAASASTTPIIGATDTDDPTRATERGCVRTRCDQNGGFVCLQDWECAPDRATEDTGCAAIPCDTLGHCSIDSEYICHPTSSAQHPATKDPFGCVTRNCEEGFDCMYNYNGQNFSFCEPSAPGADEYGCHLHTCTETPSACVSGAFRCDPSAANADRLGCVPVSCDDGYVCPDSWTCDPTGRGHDQFGCVPIVSGSGGAGGAGGSGGSGGGRSGSGTGGVGRGGAAGTAGSTGGTVAVGGTNANGGAAGSTGLMGSGGSRAAGGVGATGGAAAGNVTGMCVAQ